MPEPTLHTVTIQLCSLCLDGAGGECHVPGCALWLNRAPDLSLRDHPAVTMIDGKPSPAYVEETAADHDPMHPNGRCKCFGEGRCEWCKQTEAAEALETAAAEAYARGLLDCWHMKEPLRIVCVAARLPSGEIRAVPAPARHPHLLAEYNEHCRAEGWDFPWLGWPAAEMRGCEHGFLTTCDHFVTRAEALPIALAAGQVKGGSIIGGALTSEDLW